MAFCQNCGSKLREGAQFCENCGEKISAAQQASASPAPDATPLSSQPQHQTGSVVGGAAAGIGTTAGATVGGIGGGATGGQAPQPPQHAPQYEPIPYQAAPSEHSTAAHGGSAGAPQTPLQKLNDMFFTYHGRLNRKPFILRGLLLGVLSLLISTVMEAIADSTSTASDFVALLLLLAIIVICVASIMLTIRRWHDLGLTGWLTLLSLIPGVNFFVGIFLWVKKGTDGSNKYGEDPLA